MSRIEPYMVRSVGLGESASTAQLIEGALVPGEQGVTLTDKTVRFGDLYRLTQKTGIEHALTREIVNGETVFRLYSGGRNAVTTPRRPGVRVYGHTHPSGTPRPSPRDIDVLNRQFIRAVENDPFAPVPHERVIYGAGNSELTIYYPSVLR